MHTPICDELGIEFPIFAFTHCRDVVVAVSKAGGFGVLGAVGFSPEQLEIELKWIDEHIGDKPYGVDIVIPGKYEGMGEMDPAKLEETLRAAIPPQHRQFVEKVLKEAGVPELPPEERHHELLGWTAATASPQVDVALKHEKVRLIANALGTPPGNAINMSTGSVDDMAAGVVYLGVLSAALNESPALAPKCGGQFVPPFEVELAALRTVLSLDESDRKSRFIANLAKAETAGFLEELTWVDLHRQAWGAAAPDGLDLRGYRVWRKKNLKRFSRLDYGSVEVPQPRPIPVEPLVAP